MPIPFAEYTTGSGEQKWNLQLHFWQNAVEHFEQIRDNHDLYGERGDAVFEVDACMVIVLAGTSLSQLLGQQLYRNAQFQQDRVPPMQTLYRKLIQMSEGADRVALEGLRDEFNEFVEIYDAIRHFGEPKHKQVRAIDKNKLCRFLTNAQNVWTLVGKVGGYDPVPNVVELDNEFCLE